jgi:hypothetical protein
LANEKTARARGEMNLWRFRCENAIEKRAWKKLAVVCPFGQVNFGGGFTRRPALHRNTRPCPPFGPEFAPPGAGAQMGPVQNGKTQLLRKPNYKSIGPGHTKCCTQMVREPRLTHSAHFSDFKIRISCKKCGFENLKGFA